MRVHDISLTIHAGMPVWPGDPGVSLERVERMEAGANANVSRMSLGVHTGTHVDAPFHFLPGGATVETMSLRALIGRVQVIELMDVDEIEVEHLRSAGIIGRARRLLFKTRNSVLWERNEANFRQDFVGLSPEAAAWLVARGIWLVGVDYLSVAPWKKSRPTHEALLSAGVVVLEGLDLSQVHAGRYTLYCLPLKLLGCDGAPARAILIEGNR